VSCHSSGKERIAPSHSFKTKMLTAEQKAARKAAKKARKHKKKSHPKTSGKGKKGKQKKKKSKKGKKPSRMNGYKLRGGGGISFNFAFDDPPKRPMASLKPKSGGHMRIEGNDFNRRFTSNASVGLQTVHVRQQIHPNNTSLFSNLISVAQNYRQYKFNRLCFYVIGKENVSVQGDFYGYVDEDPSAVHPTDEKSVLNFERAATCMVYKKMSIELLDHKWLFTDQTATDAADQRLQQAGTLIIASQDVGVASAFIGHFWVEWDVEFKDLIPNPKVGFSAATNDNTLMVADGTTVTTVNNWSDLLWQAGAWAAGAAKDYIVAPDSKGADLTELNSFNWRMASIDAQTPMQIEWWNDFGANDMSERPKLKNRHNTLSNCRVPESCPVSLLDTLPLDERKKFVKNLPGEPLVVADDAVEIQLWSIDDATGGQTLFYDTVLAANASAFQHASIAIYPPANNRALTPNPWHLITNIIPGGHSSAGVIRQLLDASLTVSKWSTDQLTPDDGTILPMYSSRIEKLERELAALLRMAAPAPEPPRKRIMKVVQVESDDDEKSDSLVNVDVSKLRR
jgi:hypothetical protein